MKDKGRLFKFSTPAAEYFQPFVRIKNALNKMGLAGNQKRCLPNRHVLLRVKFNDKLFVQLLWYLLTFWVG